MAIPDQLKIEKLKAYFAGREDVAMAFLFGSRAKNAARGASDWDIGVYFVQESENAEHEVWSAVERVTGAETDLVVLNRAPAHLAWSIVRGPTLAINDRALYLRLLSVFGDEAQDYYETASDYYQIFQRSSSLAPADRRRLERLIEFLETEVSEYPRFRQLSREEYLTRRDIKRNLEHWVEHLVHGAIDVAKIVLASERRVIPETYKEIVEQLSLVSPFAEEKLGDRLAAWVQLRNLIAHEYLENRWRRISQFLSQTEPLWQKLIAAAKKFASPK